MLAVKGYGTAQCAIGQDARALAEGKSHSASAIDAVVPGLVPKAAGWGEYHNGESLVYFFLEDFHDMNLSAAPEPVHFTTQVAELHRRGTSCLDFPFQPCVAKWNVQ